MLCNLDIGIVLVVGEDDRVTGAHLEYIEVSYCFVACVVRLGKPLTGSKEHLGCQLYLDSRTSQLSCQPRSWSLPNFSGTEKMPRKRPGSWRKVPCWAAFQTSELRNFEQTR